MTDYEAIFLDADGTIFDYDQGEEYALARTFQEAGLEGDPVQLLELYREVNSRIWREFEAGRISAEKLKSERFRRFLDRLGVEGDPVNLSSTYLDYLSQATFLLPGAREVLEKLQPHYPLILLTNGLSRVQRRRVEGAGLGEFFQELIISEELGVAKPDPAIFEQARQAVGQPTRSRILMVGDSLESDIRGGLEAGLQVCWLREDSSCDPGSLKPHYIIDDIKQLPPILEGGKSNG